MLHLLRFGCYAIYLFPSFVLRSTSSCIKRVSFCRLYLQKKLEVRALIIDIMRPTRLRPCKTNSVLNWSNVADLIALRQPIVHPACSSVIFHKSLQPQHKALAKNEISSEQCPNDGTCLLTDDDETDGRISMATG